MIQRISKGVGFCMGVVLGHVLETTYNVCAGVCRRIERFVAKANMAVNLDSSDELVAILEDESNGNEN